MVSFRLRGTGLLKKPELKSQKKGTADPREAFVEEREVYLYKTAETRKVNTFDFERLKPGNEIMGPAIIWTPITTVVVNPGQSALCDEFLNIIITKMD